MRPPNLLTTRTQKQYQSNGKEKEVLLPREQGKIYISSYLHVN